MMATKDDLTTVTQLPLGTPFQQAFELLTASLLLLDGKEGGNLRTVCVMATHAGYGASTTALNLAMTVASSGRRTLLIDANLRTPSLHRPFDFAQSPGLAEILLNKATLRDGVRATKTSNLYVLPAGEISVSPHALFQATTLGSVFEQVSSSYDFAVVDTPPVLRYPDALHVARMTSGGILIIPAGGTPRRTEIEARRRLERADIRILGVVMNRVHPRDTMQMS
jgi:capsular exopolysaccharide synthesis family protein